MFHYGKCYKTVFNYKVSEYKTMMNVYFTSDSHFNHRNIIRYNNRPFIDVDEMNECLVDSWNEVVGKRDLVYDLGDVGKFSSVAECSKLLDRLNGKIVLIKGNHDDRAIVECSRFSEVVDYKKIKINKLNIIMTHYAQRVWYKQHSGAYHLFGHSHGRLSPYGKSFDVGVDCWNFKPISIDEVHEKMTNLISINTDYTI